MALFAVLAACVATAARADSSWSSGGAAARLATRAHLDFRVTVLPSMGLRLDGTAATVAGTQGLLLLLPPSSQPAGTEGPAAVAMLPLPMPQRVVLPAPAPAIADAAPYTLVSP